MDARLSAQCAPAEAAEGLLVSAESHTDSVPVVAVVEEEEPSTSSSSSRRRKKMVQNVILVFFRRRLSQRPAVEELESRNILKRE